MRFTTMLVRCFLRDCNRFHDDKKTGTAVTQYRCPFASYLARNPRPHCVSEHAIFKFKSGACPGQICTAPAADCLAVTMRIFITFKALQDIVTLSIAMLGSEFGTVA
jgi:hypothetical protein